MFKISANFSAQLRWNLIDPVRVPEIAAARDNFERARDSYLIALRDLRLTVATAYFNLQRFDESVNVGKQSVVSSLISLRDARARYQAGVATKLEVLEAETQQHSHICWCQITEQLDGETIKARLMSESSPQGSS